jgi:hypothetical protein
MAQVVALIATKVPEPDATQTLTPSEANPFGDVTGTWHVGGTPASATEASSIIAAGRRARVAFEIVIYESYQIIDIDK